MKRWGVSINMVKVSHHGRKWERWRPLSAIEVEKQHGPLPAQHQVYHLDGNSLNDIPDNLVVTRSDRLQLNLQRSRSALRKQREKRSSAVQRSNRMRGRINRSVHIRLGQFYPVSHATRTIICHPFRTKRQAERVGERDEYLHLQIVAVRGAKLITDCADYTRSIPNEGQAWVWRGKGDSPEVAISELAVGTSDA
jgi:hypothetical protein